MERVIYSFIKALRNSGVRISPSETIDAMNAMGFIGYEDKQVLQDSLSVSLAKSQHEKEVFKDCFDRFFQMDAFSQKEEIPDPFHPHETRMTDSPLTQMLLSGDSAGLSFALRQAAQDADITGIWFFTQKGQYIQRILKGMGQEGLDQDIQRLGREKDSNSLIRAQMLKEEKERVIEKVKDFVEQQFSLYAGAATEEIIEKYLRDAKLSNLEQRDYQRLHPIIRKMVKRLNDKHSRRRKHSRRGSLDLKRTLRENVAYQGLLFDPQWKAKKIDRQDIIVLCDISRSVQAVSRFMLLFLYSLNEEIARLRSFVFCSNLVEVSHIFETYDVQEALVRLQKSSDLGVVFGRTDYGQVFRDFEDNWIDKITKKSTVIILGDARNNYGNPQSDVFRLIRERSRRIIWLNPEPPTFWGTGDSEMKRYLPYCFLARECSTVNHLERIVDFLLRTRG